MNKELLETQWPQIREILKEKFSNLSEDDIRQINGRYDQLVTKLEQKYGYSRAEAEERIKSWNFDRFATPTTARGPIVKEPLREEQVKTETSNLLKFLMVLIPLLLIAAYIFSTAKFNEEQTTTPRVTQEQMITETPADRVISNGIRDNLMNQQQFLASDIQNVQITTNNGVVTLSGTVPSAAVRDAISNAATNFSGVTRVVNNLQVK